MKKKAKVKETFTIILPKMFGEKEIGYTFASKPEQVVGRELTVSALDVVDNMNKYYLKLTFKVKKVEGNKAFTEFYGSECLQDYISRMVVRRIRRIDTVQDLYTKDKVKLRVKSILTVPRKAKSSIQKKMSDKIKEMIKNEVENKTLEEFVKSLISDEIKMKIITEGKKIYPIRNFEIRKVEVLPEKEGEKQS
ncbi:MAG: 30S ribosomal protein S3ae [Candidatus Aenigmatarchaeota archaeon]